jgi:uncharacterized protein YdaU (DUF1376 family)
MHLSCEQHGAYVLLMLAYYRIGQPLDDDNASLAGVVKLTPRKWLAMRPVLARFFQIKGGLWRHKRIDAEIAEQHARHDERRRAGIKGAGSRWQNPGKPHRDDMAEPLAEPSDSENPPSPYQKCRGSRPEHQAKPTENDIAQLMAQPSVSHHEEKMAELSEPLPKMQRLTEQNPGKPRAKICHTSQEKISALPRAERSSLAHARDATPPPLPSQGDGDDAALRAPVPQAEPEGASVFDDPALKAYGLAKLQDCLDALRGKRSVLAADAAAPSPPEPRIIEFRARLQRLNTLAGERLDGHARHQAWEVIAEADALGPDAIPPPMQASLATIESLDARAGIAAE